MAETAPEGQFLWNNQQMVHLFVNGPGEPWATIHTKKPAGLDLVLTGPKNRFALGRIASLGAERELTTERPDKDVVKLKFRSTDEVGDDELVLCHSLTFGLDVCYLAQASGTRERAGNTLKQRKTVQFKPVPKSRLTGTLTRAARLCRSIDPNF